MASHIIAVFIASVLIAAVSSQNSTSLCPRETPLSIEEAYEKADNVFLGIDVTDLAGCQANDGTCSRRQISFQVLCVLKQTQELSAWDLTKPILIGQNRSVRACDRTYFGYGATEPMIVMVTAQKFAVNRPYLDWHETNNATRAHYTYGERLQMELGLTCNVENPFDHLRDSCAVGRQDCCASRCRVNIPIETDDAPDTEIARAWFSAAEDRSVGNHCCKQLKAGPVSSWVTAGSHYNHVNAHAFDEIPLPVVEVSRSTWMNVPPNERLAVAVYAMVKNGTGNDTEMLPQVLWLDINIEVIHLPDGFYQLNTRKGITLVNYTMVLPGKPIPAHIKIYTHPRLPHNSKINVTKYEYGCIDTEENFLPSCIFMLDDFLEAYNAKPLATINFDIKPDDWSVWTAIKHYGVTPLATCPLINPNLIPYKDTVLCPSETQEPSGGSTVCSTSILVFTLSTILLYMKAF